MNDKLKGGILTLLGAASFGFLSTIVKFGYAKGYSLGEITGSQSFTGMIILWVLYFFYVKANKSSTKVQLGPTSLPSSASLNSFKVESRLTSSKWSVVQVMIAGFFTGLVAVFYYQSVKLLPASVAIILLMQNVWMSVLLEYLLFKKQPTIKQYYLLALVLVGTVFAGGLFSSEIYLNFTGVVYGLLSALCYSLFLMGSGRVGNELPALKKSALMITGSCLITWIIFPPVYFFNGVYLEDLYLWGIALALLGTVIPPLFFSIGVPKVGISIGAILSATELPVAVLSSAFILQESVDILRWVGVVLILGSVIASNLDFTARPAEAVKS